MVPVWFWCLQTHTMTGTNVYVEDGRGINYRAMDDLFAIRDRRIDEVSHCSTSCELFAAVKGWHMRLKQSAILWRNSTLATACNGLQP
jgi:hypothetical protein